MSDTKKARPPSSREEALAAEIEELRQKAGLSNWSELVAEIRLPSDLAVAVATNRPEMARLAKPRALTEEECAHLYKAIEVYIRTNQALQQHSHRVADLAERWLTLFAGIAAVGRDLVGYARWETHRRDDNETGT